MKLILIKDVENLGKAGEEIEVKDGYASNYLLPRNLAVRLTKANLKVVEDIKRKESLKLKKEKGAAQRLADKIAVASCTISVEAGEEDKLFGSVTSEMIAEAYAAEGFEIDKKRIELETPIKKLGVYHASFKIHPEVSAQLKIWVVKK